VWCPTTGLGSWTARDENGNIYLTGNCCSNSDSNGLWYNDNWPSSTFTNTWLMVAERFAGNPMTGYDLHNEPRPATIGGQVLTPGWGSGNGSADFRQLYQNTIGRLRAVETGISHLMFCEGLSYAGDLTGWGAHPVTGENIVASAHDYPWFHRDSAGNPQGWSAYSAQNEARFGYLETQNRVPVWIGECGSNTDASRADFNHGWFPNFLRWAQENNSHWCWWVLSATDNQGTEPATNIIKVKDGQREGFGLICGQDWLGSQVDTLDFLAPVIP
jgi:endoglucanase